MKSGSANRKTIILLAGLVICMAGLSFAAVPFYNMFCKVTGFGGTTQRAAVAPEAVKERWITVRFNADVNRDLAWEFRPEQNEVKIKVGEVGLTQYHARNLTRVPLVGTAVYNVQPDKAGVYFNKVQCFCFVEQLLRPGETGELPVTFFVDPDFVDDPEMADISEITLSYTFYKSHDQSLARKPALAEATQPPHAALQDDKKTGTMPATTIR